MNTKTVKVKNKKSERKKKSSHFYFVVKARGLSSIASLASASSEYFKTGF